MNKMAKNYFYNVLYNVLVLITPLITAPYLARILGPEQLGIYSYVNSATSIIISISLLGLYSYGSRQIAYERDNKEKMSQLFWNLMALRIVLGIMGTIVYFLYAGFTEYKEYFLLYYIYYLGNVLDCTWLFIGVEEMKIPAIKNIFAKLLSLIGIFVFVRTTTDLWKYLMLLASATFLGIVLTYPQIKKYVMIKKIEVKTFKKHILGAIILFLPSLISTIYLQVDKVMIEWLTGNAAQVSFYDQAEKIVMIPLTFITVLSTVMMPRIANEFAHRNNEHIQELLMKACKLSMFMAYPLMFGIAGIAKGFIPWYLGKEFEETAIALMILSPIVISNTLIGISGTQYFIATNQTSVLIKSNSFAAILNVVINALLIPKFGYVGAAVATLIANYTLVMVQYRELNNQLHVAKLFEKTFRYLGLSLIMFIVVYLIGKFRGASPITTLIQILVGGSVYLGFMVIIKDPIIWMFFSQICAKIQKKK